MKHQDDFKALCQSHNVKYLCAFGSSITNKFKPEISDIDLLVELDSSDPMDREEKLMSLWDTFERFFNRKVDLLTDGSIKNPYLRKSIDTTKYLLYDGKGSQIFL
ncbi:nucleotidyltransferase family protein [Natronoflexus pectinivorans]|uniref:nucleotidyltransferase family protein n=1 Tax=Natronoflexus pectinivorans TaxID=682526 RepID=UPI001A9FE249